MGQAEFIEGQGGGKCAGIPDFKPVGEEHHLDTAVAVVVTMRDGVDDGFGDDITRNFVGDRGPRAFLPGTDTDVDLGHDEVDGLVNQFEGRAFVNLVGGNRFGDFGPVEVGTLDLGGNDEALRVLAEEEDGCIGWFAVVKQVEMGKDFLNVGLDRERKIVRPPSPAHEADDGLGVEILQRCLASGTGVPRATTKFSPGFKLVDEAGVNSSAQFGRILEAAAHKLAAGITDESLHFRLFGFVRHSLDKNQAWPAQSGGFLEFAMSRREAIGCFPAIFVAQDSKVEIALGDLFEIDRIGSPVSGRDVPFEDEGFEKLAQQRIIRNELAEDGAFLLELLLNAADEDIHILTPIFWRMTFRALSVSLACSSRPPLP